MGLEDSDFLGWYNAEISRYRDHEWRLVSYSVGLSSAVVLFAHGSETKGILPTWAVGLAVALFVSLLVAAQFHTHLRLNEYRRRRELLLLRKDHRAAKIAVQLCRNWLDRLYFLSFVLLSALFGVAASYVLLTGV